MWWLLATDTSCERSALIWPAAVPIGQLHVVGEQLAALAAAMIGLSLAVTSIGYGLHRAVK
jgi:hypothetical protein